MDSFFPTIDVRTVPPEDPAQREQLAQAMRLLASRTGRAGQPTDADILLAMASGCSEFSIRYVFYRTLGGVLSVLGDAFGQSVVIFMMAVAVVTSTKSAFKLVGAAYDWIKSHVPGANYILSDANSRQRDGFMGIDGSTMSNAAFAALFFGFLPTWVAAPLQVIANSIIGGSGGAGKGKAGGSGAAGSSANIDPLGLKGSGGAYNRTPTEAQENTGAYTRQPTNPNAGKAGSGAGTKPLGGGSSSSGGSGGLGGILGSALSLGKMALGGLFGDTLDQDALSELQSAGYSDYEIETAANLLAEDLNHYMA